MMSWRSLKSISVDIFNGWSEKCGQQKDITLPTKVHLVKAMVFPVVMYGCESWTVKKAESQRIDAFELRCGEDS